MSGERIETAGTGWYEWIAMPTATTHAAYVHEGGSVYLPDGEFSDEDFLLAAAEGRAYRLVRASLLAEAEARGARSALLDFAAHFEKRGGAWGRMSVVEYIRGEYLDAVAGGGHACDNCLGIDPRSCINYDPRETDRG